MSLYHCEVCGCDVLECQRGTGLGPEYLGKGLFACGECAANESAKIDTIVAAGRSETPPEGAEDRRVKAVLDSSEG